MIVKTQIILLNIFDVIERFFKWWNIPAWKNETHATFKPVQPTLKEISDAAKNMIFQPCWRSLFAYNQLLLILLI